MVRTLALLATAGLATLVSAAPIETRQQTCYSGFYMIVARGSGEAAGEGKPEQVADAIAAQVPDSASVAVDYPAAIISSSSNYVSSVIDGINDTKTKLQNYVNACGASSRVVLIGYSQGGNVMTDLLAGGVDKPDPIGSDLAQYVKAVTVFGDPTYTTGQSFDVGTATKDGIFSREAGGDSLALLNQYASIIQSYCDSGDPVCASGDDLDVHFNEVSTNAQAATDFVVGLA